MSRLQEVSPNAEIVSKAQARAVNVAASIGLQNVLKSNLGPRGTLKMLVGGAGQIKLTKDGNVLLREMQIQHPTALMIARTATAQDDVTGDGTTTTVLLCGELLRQAERYAAEGLHPRVITDGFDIARDATLKFLDEFKVEKKNAAQDRDLLTCIAGTSLKTKLDRELADKMTEAVVDAIQCIAPPDTTDSPIDLNMIEIMAMPRKMGTDSRFVNGLVLDHGGRHPDMPKVLNNCHIMTCNVTFEYERTEVQSGFFYKTADEREKLVESERKWLDERCKQVVDFKRRVCKDGESFVMINQKGIDPLSLDIFAKEGILCLRRAKRRNMERMTLACGGSPIHSVEDLDESQLGWANKVSEVTLGEDKFTFVEECKHPKSCTLLLQGPNTHTIAQIQDAVRDGLRAVKNAIEDAAVVPGAGAFELAAAMNLKDKVAKETRGRAKLGVEAYAEALLIVPKTLAENSGLDVQDSILRLVDERDASGGTMAIGLDCQSGEPMIPADEGIWDNVRVKRQCLYLSTVLANQLLLVDEVMRAGKQMGRQPPEDDGMGMGGM
uniref:T-complex protein 1 subunit zeta n=2 Tax=Ditylum brightwellii TaxID=49249 RepID=A0A6S9AY65_9STRA